MPNNISSSIQALLATQAEQYSNNIALLAPGREPLTYTELHNHAQTVKETLNNLGIQQGDVVAIVLPNGSDMASAFLTVATCATTAPLNPAYRANDYEFYLSDLQAKAIIIQHDLASPIRHVAQQKNIPLLNLTPTNQAGRFTLTNNQQSTVNSQQPTANSQRPMANDIALILHTSGTTSRPKMVPLSHQNLLTSANNIRQTLQLTPEDTCLNVMPLFHIHGLMGAVLSSITAGATLVGTPGFDATRFFNWLAEFQPTWYTAVPTIHQAVLNNTKNHTNIVKASRLRFIRSSSSALPPQVMAALEQTFNAPMIESYGMTEASHQITSNPLPPLERKAGSVGRPAGPHVSIMDKIGNLLPNGQIGEIVIKGENVTNGYAHSPTANAQAFTNDWFRTGDEGYFDEDGYLFISGRIKEIINRGGEKVVPREIDECLLAHPAVKQATAFATPHPTLGEDVAAAVVLYQPVAVEEQTDLTRTLRQFAFDNLADFKVPSQIIVVNEIPKGATGKLQRIGLANKLTMHLTTPFVEPDGAVAEILAEIWCTILPVNHISGADNFFVLGGDSLIATQLFSRIESSFQVNFPLADVFAEPVLQDMADYIEDMILAEVEA